MPGALTRRARRGSCKPPGRGRDPGFTLVELLVCLALLALLAMVSLPRFAGGAQQARLSADGRVVASLLRAARETALARRENVQVVIALDARRVSVEATRSAFRLSAVERLAVESDRGRAVEGEAVIAFQPDGGSSGGRIILEAGAARRVLRVDWLTGAVTLEGG